jgi:hypothetical protein
MKKQITTLAVSMTAFTAFMGFGFAPSVSAAADSCTWTGATDSTFAEAGNWTGCDNGNVPEAADTLVFGSSATPSWTLTNDLGFAVAGVEVTANSGDTYYSVDTLTLSNEATIDSTAADAGGSTYTDVSVTNLNALGALMVSGSRLSANNWSITGVLTLGEGSNFSANSIGSAGVVVENGAIILFSGTPGTTPSFPITLGGGSGSDEPMLSFPGTGTWLFGNPITLLSDAELFLSSSGTVVNQTGSINGVGFALTLAEDSATGSRLTFSPSSNNSNTVAGTVIGGGAGGGLGADTSDDSDADDDVADAPDTGFGLVHANPIQTLAVTALLGGALFFVSRRVLAKNAVRR